MTPSESSGSEAVASWNDPSHFRQQRDALWRGAPGEQRRQNYADFIDEWLRQLFEPLGVTNGVALVAVGGHGRRELAPGSDLDLVLIGPTANTRSLADRLWYPIWDSGLGLDHSVRTLDEVVRIADTDIRAATGLLDARWIAGDTAIHEQVRSRVLANWRANSGERLRALRELEHARRDRFGEASSLLEPDVKESIGGLRDCTVIRAIAATWTADVDYSAVLHAKSFLLDVRDELHLTSGRASDRLVLQEQAAIADRLGLGTADDLLRAVCLAARSIAHATDTAWHSVERATVSAPRRLWSNRRSAKQSRRPLAEGVVATDGEVQLARSADLDDPVIALRAAAAAAQQGLRLAPATLQRLSLAPTSLPLPWPRDAREEFVSLLGAGPAALPIWEDLDQSGLWSSWIPGWERLRALPQHSPVHRFTVDRHLVEAAVQAAALTRRVHRPDLLLVGALLHDVGKGLPGDHTEHGVALVQQLAVDLGFGPADVSVLVDLCRLHLLLPETATRRDLDDPATVTSAVARLREFSVASGAIDAHELLDLLTALTEADARATGPAAWTEWRAGLIRDLSDRMAAQLRGEQPEAMAGPSQEEQELLDRGVGPGGIEVVVQQRGPVWRVVVVAHDRTGLMADVAGVLSLHRLAVRAATLHSSADQALQVWTVQPVFGEPPEASRLREDLLRVQAGSLDLHGRLAAREESYSTSVAQAAPPVVDVVQGASDRATVVEVRSHDRPALLHTIGWVLAERGANIRAARVATMGSEAVDSFYLTDAQGQPLGPVSTQQTVEAITLALVSR